MSDRPTDQPHVTLADGNTIPQIGFGVWKIPDDEAADAVRTALEAGYRHIDTAKIYGNETGVGRGIASSGVPREEITVATKLWNADQGYESTLAAAEGSLERLGIDTIDLYLIHWAMPDRARYVDTWKAFVELQRRGLVKSIAVSNFPKTQLDEVIDATGVTPVVHQIELHPYFNQEEMRAYDDSLGIRTEAWSPLGQGGDVLLEPVIVEIADRYAATPAQVVLAWHLALGVIVIPKSVTPSRIRENLAASLLTLTADEVAAISALTRPDGRIGADPAEANHLEPPKRPS